MSAARTLVAAWFLLTAPLAGAGAAPPAPPAAPRREIPPDRGRLYLEDHALRTQIRLLANDATRLADRIEIIGVLALTRETRAVPLLVNLVLATDKIELTVPIPKTLADRKFDWVGRLPVRGRVPMDLRVAALWALGEIGDPRGVVAFQHALSGIYLKKPEWQYKKGVALADGKKLGLRQLCEGHLGRLAEPLVGKYARFLLAPLTDGDFQPTSPLAGARKEQKDDGRRRAALISLAAVGDRDARAVSTLCDVLRANDAYFPWDFKIMAAQALSALVERRRKDFAVLPSYRDHMADSIAEAFIEAGFITELPEVREICGWTLRRLGWADRAAARLTAILATPNIPKQVRFRIIEFLTFIQSKLAADELIFQLYDPDDNVRWRAAIALGVIGDPRAVPFLRKLVRDAKPFVRVKAVSALGHMEAFQALPDLAVAIGDPHFHVRRAAALALGRVGRREAIPALQRALHDPRPTVRANAVIGLGYIGRASGLKAVPPLVADESPGVRFIAVQVLDRFLNKGATRALVKALGDEDKMVRQAARRSVRDRLVRQPKDAIPLLIEAIAKTTGEGRAAASECVVADYRAAQTRKSKTAARLYRTALRRINSPLTAALLAALKDPSAKARLPAADFLCSLAWQRKDRAILQRLVPLADDADVKVARVGHKARMFLANLR